MHHPHDFFHPEFLRSAPAMPLDLRQHLCRHIAFSRAAFGPGRQTNHLVAQLYQRLDDVSAADGAPEEWAEVVFWALDGLTRSLGGADDTDDVAGETVSMILDTQAGNERRDWPDWRKAERAAHGDGEKAQALLEAAALCVLSGQDLAEGDWGPEGRAMAVMLEARIRALASGRTLGSVA